MRIKHNPDRITFLVLYDIQDNDVRNIIFKYLKRIGCHNIQKSIFIGSLSHLKYNNMCESLKETVEVNDNHDSMIVVPLPQNALSAMQMYGTHIDIDLLIGRKNTVFL